MEFMKLIDMKIFLIAIILLSLFSYFIASAKEVEMTAIEVFEKYGIK